MGRVDKKKKKDQAKTKLDKKSREKEDQEDKMVAKCYEGLKIMKA